MKSIFKRALSFLIAFAFVLGALPAILLTSAAENEEVTVENGSYSLSINKTHFEVGEPILVSAVGVSNSDWLGIYLPSGETSILWDYVRTHGNGVTFDFHEATQSNAQWSDYFSLPEGRYIIRLQKNGSSNFGDYTACQVTITVGDPPLVEGDASLMSIEKSVFEVGEEIHVTATGTNKNWVGLYAVTNVGKEFNDIWFDAVKSSGTPYPLLGSKTLPAGEYVLGWFTDYNDNVAETWIMFTVVEELEDEPEIGGGEESDPVDPPMGGEDPDPTDPPTGGEGGGTEGGDNTEGGGDDNTDTPTDIFSGKVGDILGEQGVISLEKFTFKYGEPIMVTANASGASGTNDWVGIYSSLDQFTSTKWEWATGTTFDIRTAQGNGSSDFAPGVYYIRYVQDSNEVSKTVTVAYIEVIDEVYVEPDDGGNGGNGGEGGEDDATDAYFEIEKTQFIVGEPIMVTAYGSGKDWVGLFKNGSYINSAWYYVTTEKGGPGSGATYDVTKGVPLAAGTYTLALIANDSSSLKDAYQTVEIIITEKVVSAPVSATYILSNNTDGFAKGTLTVNVPNDAIGASSIYAYWAKDGVKMNGYTPVRILASSDTVSYEFTDSAIIPEGATHLLVYTYDIKTGGISEGYVSVELPQGADFAPEKAPNKSMFVISDIHITTSLTDRNANHFKKMIRECIDINPNGAPILVAGDIANSGLKEEYENVYTLYNTVLEENSKTSAQYPIYIAAGNHDFYPSDYTATREQFLSYAYLPDGTNPESLNYDCYINGIHCIFLGTDRKDGNSVYLSDETLTWLDGVLALDDGKTPTIVMLHQPMYDTVSGSLPGENWHGVTGEDRLRSVLAKYDHVMMFNGHTHWEMNSVGNIYEGTDELPIKIFNCASVAYLWTSYNAQDSGENLEGSQGYQLDFYDTNVTVRGRDFVNSTWISMAQYSIDYECASGHSRNVLKVKYANGYDKSGNLVRACSVCDDELIESECLPIITPLGYSVKENTGTGYGICAGFAINHEAKSYFESVNGVTVELGVAMFNPEFLQGDSFFVNGLISSDKAKLQVKMVDDGYSKVSVYLTGIGEDHYDLDLILCAYLSVVKTDGETKTVLSTGFVQSKTNDPVESFTRTDGEMHSVSYNSLK